jgi:hypothetical protein
MYPSRRTTTDIGGALNTGHADTANTHGHRRMNRLFLLTRGSVITTVAAKPTDKQRTFRNVHGTGTRTMRDLDRWRLVGVYRRVSDDLAIL